MDFEAFKKLWEFFKRHPLTAIILTLAWSLISIGIEIIHPKVLALFQPTPPFANLAGEYTGQIHDSGAFKLCLETKESTNHEYDVFGTMSFPDGVYVDYRGTTTGNTMNLNYTRVNSYVPDRGTAKFYAPKSKGETLNGYYASDTNPANKQVLELTRDGQPCRLATWDHGW